MCTTTIAKEPGDLSVDDFVTKYLAPNVPVLLDEQLTRTWRSRREWVLDGGEPNWDALVDLFGDAQVTATECPLPHTAAIAYDDDQQQRRTTSLRDYVEDWRGRAGTAAVGTRLWYLKDWHIQVDFPAYGAYETPALFRNDWINSFWDAEGVDDYRFCYMGPDGRILPCGVLMVHIPIQGRRRRCTPTSLGRTRGRPTCAGERSGCLWIRRSAICCGTARGQVFLRATSMTAWRRTRRRSRAHTRSRLFGSSRSQGRLYLCRAAGSTKSETSYAQRREQRVTFSC